jgi:hypothetical protein
MVCALLPLDDVVYLEHLRLARTLGRLLLAVAVLIEPLAMKLRGSPLGGKLTCAAGADIYSRRAGFPARRSRRSGSAGGERGTARSADTGRSSFPFGSPN